AAFSAAGRVAYNGAYWGNTGLSSPASGGCGFFIDSGDGTASNSTLFNSPNSAQTATASTGLTGLCIKGINVSDNVINAFQSANMDYSIDVENTGTTSFVAQDLAIYNSVNTSCNIACVKINGAQSSTDLAPHVIISGGNFFPTGTGAVGILVSHSTNVGVSGAQILPGGSGVTDISLDTVDGFTVTNSTIDGLDFGTGVGVSCLNSTKGTISNNQIKLYTSGTGIKNVGCTLVSEQGNSIAAPTGGTLGTGMSFDSGSSNNGPWSLNNIDAATVTTPVSDAGTNNNDPQLNSSRMSQATTSAFGVVKPDGTTITISGGVISASGGGGGTVVDGAGTTTPGQIAISTTTTHQIGYTTTPALGTPASGVITNLSGTCASCNIGGSAGSATTATNLAGGALGSAPYQSAANATSFITSPTTSGHTFFYGWQPSGSAIAPAAIDGATYLASPPAIGGTTPAAVTGTAVTATNGFTSSVAATNANLFYGGTEFFYNPAVNDSSITITGVPNVGTGTTSLPLVYLHPSAASTVSTWSTSGTYMGWNAASGFVGNFMDFHVNGGTSVAKLDASGNLTVASCAGCSAVNKRSIAFQYGSPGGSALSTGVMGYLTVPFACTISGWSIQVDAGTATIKFLKVAAGTAIPTLGSNSINTSGVSISTGTVIQSTTLTDFTTTAVTANDIVAADLITTSGVGYIAGQLTC